MKFSINEQCIGCTACASACPVMAIEGKQKLQHSINEKRCVGCGVCGRICPKGAIKDGDGKVISKVQRTSWKKPDFQTSRCSACSICVDICRFQCILMKRPEYKGDINVYAYLDAPGKCVGCGLCAEMCPLKVITMEGAGKNDIT